MIAEFLQRIRVDEREILRGTLTTFLLRMLGIAIEFLFHVAVARLLGAEGTGVFFIALTALTIASVFGRLGLDNVALRFVAAKAAVADWSAVRGVSSTSIVIAIGASSILAVMLIASAFAWVPRLSDFPSSVLVVTIALLAVPAMSAMYIYGEMLKGMRRVGMSQFVTAVVPFGVALAIIVVAESGDNIIGVVGALVTGMYGAAFLGFAGWRRTTPDLQDVAANFSTRSLLDTAMPLLVVKSLRLAAGWLGTLAIAWLLSDKEVGVFNVAFRTSLLLGVFLVSVNSIAAPKFAALYERGDLAGLARTARWSTLLLGALTLPIFVVLLGFPEWVMSLFGSEFVASGKAVLVILTLGQVVNILSGPVAYLLMMTGHEKDVRNATILSFTSCLVSIWPAIQAWGLPGAAATVAGSMALMNLLAAVYVRVRLGFFTIAFLPDRELRHQ